MSTLAQRRNDLPVILVAYGVDLRLVPGWQERGRGAMAPRAVMYHWTATRSASPSNPMPTLTVVRDGWGGLPGPLYHLLVGQGGQVALVSVGRANHGGRGNRAALEAATAPNVRLPWGYVPGSDGITVNAHAWAISADHAGSGPMPVAQYRAMVACGAALVELEGWSANRIYHHASSTRRKADVRGWPDLVPEVAARRRRTEPEPEPAPEEDDVKMEIWVSRDPESPDDPREHVWLIQRDLGAPGKYRGYYAWLDADAAAHYRDLAGRKDRPDVVEAGAKGDPVWFTRAGLLRKE